MAYLIGQLTTTNGYLLNLGSSNSDEVYIGYYTKYDASSADLNPIGSLPKIYVQRILIVFGNSLDKLYGIINQEPTAELIPGLIGGNQTDEDDIGLKYMEMSELSRLMSSGYGPLDSFMKITTEPNETFNIGTNASKLEKLINFHNRYRINRHKVVILPPSVHLLAFSPDDNRYNMRPFLYPKFTQSLENEILKGLNF
jgi:NAD+ synthase (glutamine-hydrolysing)